MVVAGYAARAGSSALGVWMIRIAIGGVLFLIGAFSYFAAQSSSSGGTVWIGGMLVGALLVVTGLMRLRQ